MPGLYHRARGGRVRRGVADKPGRDRQNKLTGGQVVG